jgi:hypothetical protein
VISRFGADFRYQKSLSAQIQAEWRPNLDGNLTDDRDNCTNPGGTDVFGRAATTENNSALLKIAWLDYRFPGTPVRMRVGFDLVPWDQAGFIGDNDPRFSVYVDLGDFDLKAAAWRQFESQRLGLVNDNDDTYYTFSAGYNLKPHRFQVDVLYERDRFGGADTQAVGFKAGMGFTGQKNDSVLLLGSWSGAVGPLRGLVQGGVVTGTARGGTVAAGLPAGVIPGRDYGILAGTVVAYGEVDLGVVRPFGLFIYGTADGNPADNRLHGFAPWHRNDIVLMSGTSWFAHLDTSQVFVRDYGCPGRAQGLGVANPNTPGVASTTNPGAPGLARTPANVGVAAFLTGPGTAFDECSHTVTNPFNDALGNTNHLGLRSAYSNPGTLLGFLGLKVFPLKGHQLVGWYAYRGMVDPTVLEVAFAPELVARGMTGLRKGQYHEIGGSWLWTLNPNFDIRLAGNIAIAGSGWRDLAQLANCNPGGAGPYATSTPCSGDDVALRGEARFRARF